MNTVWSHNSCTFHTSAQLMRIPFSHTTPLLVLKRRRCLRLFAQWCHRESKTYTWILPAFITGILEHNTRMGMRSRLSCPRILPLQRKRQTSNVDATFDFLLLGTNDRCNLVVGGPGEFMSFRRPAHRSGDRVTQATESSSGCDRPLYCKVLLLPLMSRPSPSTTSLPMSKDNTGLSTTL